MHSFVFRRILPLNGRWRVILDEEGFHEDGLSYSYPFFIDVRLFLGINVSLYPSFTLSSAVQSFALSLESIDFLLSKITLVGLPDASCFQIVFGFPLKCISKEEHLIFDW